MNPIIELAELCQKKFRANIETRVISVEGPDHCPTVTVETELPNGDIYQGVGDNKKEAAKAAAIEALSDVRAL